MKKFLILIVFFSFLFAIFHFSEEKETATVINEIKSKDSLDYKIKTVLFDKKRNGIKNHYTDLSDVLFYNKDYTVTKGGILYKNMISRYFNASEFKSVTKGNNDVFIGYFDGFLSLNNNYINHFVFNESIKKCISTDGRLYCIKGKDIILKDKNKFYLYYRGNEKIKDLVYYNKKLYLSFPEKVVIKNNFKTKTLNISGGKFVKVENKLYCINYHEVFGVKDFTFKSIKRREGITDIIIKDNKFYYIAINGDIYDFNDNLIEKINDIVNGVTYKNGDVYILTSKGIRVFGEKKELENKRILNNSLKDNYITSLKNYKNGLLISYFNKGTDFFENSVKDFIKDLNGVNDVLVKDNLLYIGTTEGLFVYNGKIKEACYGKKNGLPGYNISKIIEYRNDIYLGSEGGVSKKDGSGFVSVNGFQGLVNNRVNTLEVYKGFLYVGTLGGISVLNGLNVVKSLSFENLKSRWITSLKSLGDKLYIATYGGGLYIYDKERIYSVLKGRKRVFFNLNTLISYKGRYLFGGTLKSGIFVYDTVRDEYYFYDDLPSVNITALEIDKNSLFAGSDFGFWKMDIDFLLNNF